MVDFAQLLKDIDKLRGIRLKSIKAGSDLVVQEVDYDNEVINVRSVEGDQKSGARGFHEFRTIWKDVCAAALTDNPWVHVDQSLGGSGSKRNQPETILANLPYVVWSRPDNKKCIAYVGYDAHSAGCNKEADEVDYKAMAELRREERAILVGTNPRNLIYFGAPGTGKSYELRRAAEESFSKENISRVTFYPDYTYSQFVGCFKPVTRYEGAEDAPASKASTYISYEFVPGPFLSSYVKAVQNPDENYLLIVEEINRANPAAVFGDVFQLLDRKATGESEYEIAVPREMQSYLEIFLPEYATTAHITEPVKLLEEQERLKKESGRLALPSNLYIWATMNSADQGVFPMDTAFKRRWDFRYIGIDAGEDASVEIDGVMRPLCDVVVRWGKGGEHRANWNNLRKAINDFLVSDKVKLNEDKLLGPFFIKPEALTQERFAATFKDKVLLYLYEDACKTKHSKVFASDLKTYSQICNAFDERGVDIFVDDFKKYYSGEADDGSEDDGEAEE